MSFGRTRRSGTSPASTSRTPSPSYVRARMQPYVLFVNPFDPKYEIWVGERVGVDGATALLGADEAFTVEELNEKLPELLAETGTVYYALGTDRRLDRLVTDLIVRRRSSGQRDGSYVSRILDPVSTVGSMRVVKSAKEVQSLQRAIDITAQGFDRAIRATRPGLREYHVQAALENEFRRLGSQRNGYPSIVASGENSCILHYVKNRRRDPGRRPSADRRRGGGRLLRRGHHPHVARQRPVHPRAARRLRSLCWRPRWRPSQ